MTNSEIFKVYAHANRGGKVLYKRNGTTVWRITNDIRKLPLGRGCFYLYTFKIINER